MRWADGIFGGEGSRDFPGASRIDLTGTGPQVSGSRMTISVWAQPDAGTTNNFLVSRWNGAPGNSAYMLQGPPVTVSIHDGAGQDNTTGTKTFAFGGPQLHHYCLTKSATHLEGWVDGKLDARIASTRSIQNSGSPCVGDAALALPFNGTIRQVALWDETLTPWEVMQLAQGVAPWDVRGQKLRIWLPLSDWAGGTGSARDLSTRNSTATPAGGTTYAPRPASAAPRPVNALMENPGQLTFVVAYVLANASRP